MMAIHHSNYNSVYEVNCFSPDSSHMFHLGHAIVCKFRKGNHLRQEYHNKQYLANNKITTQYIEDITQWRKDMNFIFEWQKQYFTHSLRSFVEYCFATRK